MAKSYNRHMGTFIKNARNLGELTASELESVGYSSLEEIQRAGWGEVFEKWVAHYPERINLNAATALIGAIEGVDWREVPELLKAEAREFIKEIKSSF